MGIEEQKEEREVLDSIYPDEITGICAPCDFPVHRSITHTSPTDISETAYRISVALDVADLTHNSDGLGAEPPSILFHVSYPPNYPEVGPDFDLSSPPNTVQHPLLN